MRPSTILLYLGIVIVIVGANYGSLSIAFGGIGWMLVTLYLETKGHIR